MMNNVFRSNENDGGSPDMSRSKFVDEFKELTDSSVSRRNLCGVHPPMEVSKRYMVLVYNFQLYYGRMRIPNYILLLLPKYKLVQANSHPIPRS